MLMTFGTLLIGSDDFSADYLGYAVVIINNTLTIIYMVIKDIERDKYSKVIHNELNKLGIEFGRYKERWDKLSKSIETVNKDVLSIHTTTDKITKRFQEINNVEIREDNLLEHKDE